MCDFVLFTEMYSHELPAMVNKSLIYRVYIDNSSLALYFLLISSVNMLTDLGLIVHGLQHMPDLFAKQFFT